MKRLIAVGAVVACGIGMLFGTGMARAQEEPTEKPGQCTMSYYNVTMYGSKVVPGGATCYLYNVVLVGGIDVRPGGSLYIDSVSAGHPSNVGPININSGNAYIFDSTTKAISVNYATPGAVGSDAAVRICGSTLDSLSVVYTPGPAGVVVGGSNCQPRTCEECEELASSYGDSNHILGALKVAYNNALVSVRGNTIDGGVSCWYNTPPPYFNYNTVKGGISGQCVPAAKPV